MTSNQIKLLKIDESPLNLDVEDRLVVDVYDKDHGFGVRIGRAVYWEFVEAEAILNNLEKHIEFK